MNQLYLKKPDLKKIILELKLSFPIVHTLAYKHFPEELAENKVLDLIQSDSPNDKENGVQLLNDIINQNKQISLLFYIMFENFIIKKVY